MKLRSIRYIVIAVLLTAACFFLTTVKAAEDPLSISISPLTFDLSANPGDTLTNEFLVRNAGKEPTTVTIEAQDFVANGEEGQVSLTDKTSYSLASWIQVPNNNVNTIGPGQQVKVKFMIRVPYNAEPGGHYASVFAHVSPTLNNSQTGSYVGQKIGSLVLLKVAGATKEAADIETFKATKNTYAKGPVTFDVRIKSSGSIHVKPKGVIAVTDMFGKKVADITVEQKNILPGAIRHTQAKWDKTPKFGKYTATLLSYYGADNKQLTAATTFWIIPWKTIVIWLIVIIVIVVLLYLGRKRIKEAFKALAGKK